MSKIAVIITSNYCKEKHKCFTNTITTITADPICINWGCQITRYFHTSGSIEKKLNLKLFKTLF